MYCKMLVPAVSKTTVKAGNAERHALGHAPGHVPGHVLGLHPAGIPPAPTGALFRYTFRVTLFATLHCALQASPTGTR